MASLAPTLRHSAILVGALWCGTSAQEMYTTNAICRAQYCTNPIFPGLNDLARLEMLTWQCSGQDRSAFAGYMSFCSQAVLYPPALPSPNSSATALNILVKAQDDAAATMFFYHLNGLGYEAWEHQQPWNSRDSCVRDTWRMVCYTYFPRAEAGCAVGQATRYLRPCKDCCTSYLKSCQVECCDESPACVFSHTLNVGGQALLQTGYVDAAAPSALCTGIGGSHGLSAPLALIMGLFGLQLVAASGEDNSQTRRSEPRQSRPSACWAFHWQPVVAVAALAVLSTSLTGCNLVIPSHSVGNWRSTSDYLVRYEFVPPGKTPAQATLNSCSSSVAWELQCSGRGYCQAWNAGAANSVSFCLCDRDWTDPECRTRRKSQAKLFFLSLFGGILGMDYFYLGFPLWGVAKLLTLGGLGFWWIVDIIRTGAGPVYAHDFRVSPDLPHWLYVVTVSFSFIVLGFLLAIYGYLQLRNKKRNDVMQLRAAEENRQITKPEDLAALGPQYFKRDLTQSYMAQRSFSGYGATLPVSMANGGAPFAQPPQAGQPGPFAGPYGPAGPLPAQKY